MTDDITDGILGFTLAGNEAWRIGSVFCVLLFAFVIGKMPWNRLDEVETAGAAK